METYLETQTKMDSCYRFNCLVYFPFALCNFERFVGLFGTHNGNRINNYIAVWEKRWNLKTTLKKLNTHKTQYNAQENIAWKNTESIKFYVDDKNDFRFLKYYSNINCKLVIYEFISCYFFIWTGTVICYICTVNLI